MNTRTFLLAVVMAGIALCCAARPAMEFAVDGFPWWDNAGVDRNLAAIKALGVTHVRHDFWMQNFICTDKAADALTQHKLLVQKLVAAGIKVQFVISGAAAKNFGTPQNKDGSYCNMAPTGKNPSPKAYANFIKTHLPAICEWGVKRISLWNEPNLKFFLSSSSKVNTDQTQKENNANPKQAKLYYDLYRYGLAAVRHVQTRVPKCKGLEVLIGEISAPNNGIGFMDMVLKNGPLKADGLSIHPYQFCTPPNSKAKPPAGAMPPQPARYTDRDVAESSHWQCRQYRVGGMAWIPDWKKAIARWAKSKKLTTFKGKQVPLLLTEYALLRSPYSASVSEDLRAKWYPIAANWALKNKVKQMLFFQLNMDHLPTGWDSGMIDNTDSRTGLPAYNALQSWAKSHGYI
jgi:hypothetical protein